MNKRVPLASLALRLFPDLGEDTPNQRKLQALALNGTISLKKDFSGRYYAEEADLPVITDAIRAAGSRYNQRNKTAA